MTNISTVKCTREEYEALVPDENTLYVVSTGSQVTAYMGSSELSADRLTAALRLDVLSTTADYRTDAQSAARSALASQRAAEAVQPDIARDAAQVAADKDAAIVARNDAVAAKDTAVAVSLKVPNPTAADSGKVPVVKAGGSAYELKDMSSVSGITGVSVNGAAAPVQDGVAQVSAVTDVQVDGVSVVEDGVANITIPASAQADWDESDSESPAYIKNKPDVVTQDEVGVADGVAGLNANGKVPSEQLPIATNNSLGTTIADPNFGIGVSSSGKLQIVGPSDYEIQQLNATYRAVTLRRFGDALKSGLTGVNRISLTPAQKAVAPNTLGAAYEPLMLTEAPTSTTPATAVGQFAIDTVNHKVYSCEAITNTGTEETPVYEYTWREHVLLGANGLVSRAELPKAGMYGVTGIGAVTWLGTYGIEIDSNSGIMKTIKASNAQINARGYNYTVIVPGNLDYAVRSVLPNVTVIPATSTAYSLLDASATTNNHSWQYTHTPDAASTYTFPAVTDTAVAHRIKLTIDFTNVQTYSFVDASGDDIVPLFTPSIAAGDVYEFRCEYSTVQSRWLIYPCKQGAVSDDFVMRGEVGAANGVAGLDGNGKVPSAQLPVVGDSAEKRGVVYVFASYGISKSANGLIMVNKANATQIDARQNNYTPIVPGNLNYAVTAALTDANKIQLTDAQKASAQDTLGVGAAPIVQSGAPTTSTVGTVGQLYVDTATSKTYHCTAVTTSGDPEVTTYTWTDDINEKGGTFAGSIRTSYNYFDTYIYNNRILSGYQNAGTGNGSLIIGTSNNAYTTQYRGYIGQGLMGVTGGASPGLVIGKYNYVGANQYGSDYKYFVIGTGSGTSARSNGLEFSNACNLYIAGGHQQGVTVIPAATTAYTLAEGVQQHTPDSAPTYTAPTVTDETRTHEIILNVRFSATALSAAFEDSEGNAITPLSTPTIVAGSEISYLCEWSALQSKWIIMPVDMGGAQ